MTDRNIQLSEHFKLCEFVRACDPLPDSDVIENLKALCVKLEEVRSKNGKPITINTGWRTHEHQVELYNELEGKQAVAKPGNSQHELGKAADIPKECLIPSLIDWLWNNWNGGMGRYPWGIHLDIGQMRRW